MDIIRVKVKNLCCAIWSRELNAFTRLKKYSENFQSLNLNIFCRIRTYLTKKQKTLRKKLPILLYPNLDNNFDTPNCENYMFPTVEIETLHFDLRCGIKRDLTYKLTNFHIRPHYINVQYKHHIHFS